MTNTGAWRGYWEQKGFGRQSMHDLTLQFNGGEVRGTGVDCIGRFTFEGTCDGQGKVVMVKQYLGRHQVLYRGQFDGEGTIFGQWSIWPLDRGEFVLSIVRDRESAAEMKEIVPIGEPQWQPVS